jgi:hypothetical protein
MILSVKLFRMSSSRANVEWHEISRMLLGANDNWWVVLSRQRGTRLMIPVEYPTILPLHVADVATANSSKLETGRRFGSAFTARNKTVLVSNYTCYLACL